jgi:uncharacterized protein YlxP (DUF503 family)
VYVGVAKISLVVGDAHSLKEKRMVLRSIKDRVRDRLHVTVNEVGELETWQRAELGCAVVSADRTKAAALVDEVVRVAMSAGGAQIVAIAKDVTTFEGQAVPFTPIDDRTGAGDKAQGAEGFDVPKEWAEEMIDE